MSWIPFVAWAVIGYVLAAKVFITGPQRDPAGYLLFAIVVGIAGGAITRSIIKRMALARAKRRRDEQRALRS